MTNRITPMVCAEYDDEHDAYDVEIQLPGVKKKDIDLKALPGGFMVRAPRGNGDDTEYLGSYAFCCPVDEEHVDAEFHDGLLKATFRLQEPHYEATRVKIS